MLFRSRVYEPTLDDLKQEYPAWHCYQGIDKRWYARQLESSPQTKVCGEDLAELRHEISVRQEQSADRFRDTLDAVISDLLHIRNQSPISEPNKGVIAAMLGRLAHELRSAADLIP